MTPAGGRQSSSALRVAVQLVVTGLAVYAGARASVLLHTTPMTISPLWPPAGIAVGFGLLFGPHVVLAMIPALMLHNSFLGIGWGTSVGLALANICEAVFAIYFLRWFGLRTALDRVRDIILFISVGVLSAFLASLIGVPALIQGGIAKASEYPEAVATWWLGNTIGFLVLGSLILTVHSVAKSPWPRVKWLESILILTATASATAASFYQRDGSAFWMPHWVFPAIIWAAMRLGPPGVAVVSLALCAITTHATLYGLGPFIEKTPTDTLISLQVFIGVMTLTGLILAAAAEERQAAVRSMLAAEEERLQSEHERQRVLERLRSHIERMPLGYVMMDEEFRITQWNPAAEAIFGWSERDVAGTHPFDRIVPEKARTQVARIFERLRAGEMAVPGVNDALTKEGRTIQCEWTNTALFDEEGRFVGAAAMFRDCTEQMLLHRSLETSESRYRMLFEAAQEGILTLDREGCVTFANRRAAEVTVREPGGLVGLRFRDVVTLEDRDKIDSLLAHLRKPAGPTEIRLMRPDGRTLTVLAALSPLEAREGEAPTRLLTLTDISEWRDAEAQLRQIQKMDAIGRLAGGVAHDFNNLLTIIVGYSEVLLGKLPAEDATRDTIAEIFQAGQRAASLTRQLLAFSRRSIVKPAILNMNEKLRASEKMIRRLVGEDVAVYYTLTKEPWPVKIDPGHLDQVILNLVVNARDAMPTGGTLTLETDNVQLDDAYVSQNPEARNGHHLVFTVTDTGVGMTGETRARVFEPFFTTKESHAGTGLGLPTVYGIVKQAGGHITVYSEVGGGSVFRVYLPSAEDEDSDKQDSDVHGSQPGAGHETLLLVEDDTGVREFARRMLEEAGYTVIAAANGRDAMEAALKRDTPVDLLLTDVIMPGISGRELAETLKRRWPGLKVIYMSGYTEDTIVRHGIQRSETAFVQKPYTRWTLIGTIREVLDEAK